MKEDKYQEENTQLRLMFLERQKRLAVCQKSQIDPNTCKNKQIVNLQQSTKQSGSNNNIRLNSIIYDKRPTHLKRNKITLSSLLHENVDILHRQPYSANVQSLMITTYGFETDTFLPILSKGLPMFIFNRDQERPGQIFRRYSGFQNLVIISPPKNNTGYGVFHTKLWLVKFRTFLRVIVCTGNNHLMDWTVWQNAYWYHDCPLLQEKDTSKQLKTEPIVSNQSGWGQIKDFDYEKDFIITLKRVIAEMSPKNFDILKEMKLDLDRYSFAGIDVVLIPSFPGRWKEQQMQKVGLSKVRKIMHQHKKRFTKATVTCNSTSLGKLDQKIIREIYFAFNPWVQQFTFKNFQLVYPTESYVKDQTCGEAGVLFLTKENYEKCELKKQIFYRYEESAQNGVSGGIPHLKTIIIEEEGEEEKCVFYLGSHNLTRAAWGSYQKNDSQINCSNSQLGLLFLGYRKAELKYWLPYKWPANKYSKEDTPFIRSFNQ